jgi:hypothetical protein
MLAIGCFAAMQQVLAQNLDAGKSPSQIFAGTCNACHKGPHGLLKTVPAGSLSGFLRQHYTTSPEMAGVLASYLVSNGAADGRAVAGQKGTAREARQDPRPDQLDRFGRPQRPASEVIRPEADIRQEVRRDPDGAPESENGRLGHGRRLARPGGEPDGARPAREDQVPGQVEGERGPDGRKLSSKRLSKRGKPGSDEAPKGDTAKDEPAGAPGQVDNPQSQTAATEQGKAAEIKPTNEVKPTESTMSEPKAEEKTEPKSEAKIEAKSEANSDPQSELKTGQSNSGEGKSDTAAPTVAAAVSNGAPEPVTGSSTADSQAAPALVVTAPPPPPVTPAGPPAPPISQ